MLWQLLSSERSMDAAGTDDVGSSESQAVAESGTDWDEMGEAEGSLEDEQEGSPMGEGQVASTSPQGGGSSGAASSLSSSGSSQQAFQAAWRQQMKRAGLVGALVAAAYPDRIAQCTARGSGRPAITLCSGK